MHPSPNKIFENAHFLVVDKPAGWLSVPSRIGARDERPCLGVFLQDQLGAQLWPVHRLDEEVTGVILFAKTAAAHKSANAWFESHAIKKTYEAFTDSGDTPDGKQTWEARLMRGKKRAYEAPHGKPSTTEATVISSVALDDGAATLWQLHPVTGRPHQLRYELMRHGFPIIGDVLYGSKRTFTKAGIALRCVTIDVSTIPAASALGLPPTLTASPLLEFIA